MRGKSLRNRHCKRYNAVVLPEPLSAMKTPNGLENSSKMFCEPCKSTTSKCSIYLRGWLDRWGLPFSTSIIAFLRPSDPFLSSHLRTDIREMSSGYRQRRHGG